MQNTIAKSRTPRLRWTMFHLIFITICTLGIMTGCTSNLLESSEELPSEDKLIRLGTQMEIEKPDEKLTLREHKEALAADGLYYASWSMGESKAYENSDGDTVDLYDAQLYLLLSECNNSEDAQTACDSWLETAKENYEISKTEEIICNSQTYTCIHYQCSGKDNPYDRGISAFAVSGSNAVCIEFTCQKGFTENLQNLLTNFLNGCHYKMD